MSRRGQFHPWRLVLGVCALSGLWFVLGFVLGKALQLALSSLR